MAVQVVVVQGVAVLTKDGNDPRQLRAFREKAKNSGSAAMNVDGSSTSVEFTVNSESGYAKMIGQVRLLTHGSQLDIAGVQGQSYGADQPNGLTNGIRLYYTIDEDEIDIFLDPIQILTDYYWYAEEIQSDIKAVSSQSDLLIVDIHLCTPVILLPDKSDKLAILIQDDLSGLARFEAMVLGAKELIS
ncbi:MAG: hypothetical protein ACXADB_13625 [Candidatus Hermodarchaeia archaeon]|jgi:hypothetical protein